MIGPPAEEAGGVQLTVAERSPAIAVTAVGGLGPPTGVTGVEAALGALTPALLIATTVKV